MKIPSQPLPEDQLFARLDAYRQHDLDWRGGRTFGYVYHAGRAAEEVAKRAYAAFLTENGLDPTAFSSLLRLENELVGMMLSHLGGEGPDACGTFTSGGTESILLAVKAARDHARATRPEVGAPEMVLPDTAHAAFFKAAHYLGVTPVVVPVRAEDGFRADVAAMAARVTERTILLVGSAPGYAHGVVDPIVELGRLAQERGLLLHVDACIGGFLLPYFRRLGAPVPAFDLSVPGVTSLSVDLHKYAYAPKGASLVLYNDRALRRHQVFACSSWAGYTVVNPTVQSSKSGGPLAAAWAVLHALGDEGYQALARDLLEATRAAVAGIEAIPGLRVLGRPEMSLVAFASDVVSVFHVADEMKARGWYVQPQLARNASPANLHLTIGPSNVPHIDGLLADLRASVEAARPLPSGQLARAVQQALAGVDPAALGPGAVRELLGMAGIQGTGLPARMAPVNEVLNVLPPALSERLLADFVNELFAPA